MKKIFAAAFAFAAISLGLAGVAAAAPTYVELSGGGSFSANSASGAVYGVALGKDFGALRLEGEYLGSRSVNGNAINSVNSNLGNVNLYVQPFKLGAVTPFVDAGIGYGSVEDRASQNGLVFNLGAGASVPISTKLALVGRYRYFLADNVTVGPTPALSKEYDASVVTVGLRYTF
jgi:opacity protein-like surface antigen